MKVVINSCFGGFGLSDVAYEWLIAHGVKSGPYKKEPLNPNTGLYDIKVPENEGEIIFDNKHPDGHSVVSPFSDNRYWDTWIEDKRDWPLLVQCVEELGTKANGWAADLKVVEIPDGIAWEIDEYDGSETVEEKHRSWA